MDINIKFLEKLTFPDDKELFEVAVSIFVARNEGNNPSLKDFKALSQEKKVKITKNRLTTGI